MVSPEGLEPSTSWVEAMRSDPVELRGQLSIITLKILSWQINFQKIW